MPESVLILGDGFVGSELRDYCQERNWNAHTVGRSGCDLLDAVATRSLIEQIRPDVIVLTAAVVRLKGNNLRSMLENVSMVENVVMASTGVEHLIFLSSIDVYGNENLSALTPTSPVRPFDPYGASKLLGERWVLGRGRGGRISRSTVLRLTGVYGPRDHGLSTISRLVRAAGSGKITLTGTGAVRRDFCYGPDLVRLIGQCIENSIPGTFNVARGESRSLVQFAEQVRATINPAAQIGFQPAPPENRDYDLEFDQADFYQSFPGFMFKPLAETLAAYK